MVILLISAFVFTVAYQVDKPCDDACFQAKIQQESKKKQDRDNDDWRYERFHIRDRR
jgi:hypothetical protein